MKKICYFDMDGVLADFIGHVRRLFPEFDNADAEEQEAIIEKAEILPEFFADLAPIEGAIEAFKAVASDDRFEAYILSTASWNSPDAWKDKRTWVDAHIGELAKKRLILSHNKHLNVGDYLIDDRIANGVDRFQGEHIHFGTEAFPNWKTVTKYLLEA